MGESLRYLWAKTGGDESDRWHPLILHVLDVATCADAILAREPSATRSRVAEALGLNWEAARPWVLLIVACHDLGKASPGFQFKWPRLIDLVGLSARRSINTDINHAFVSQIALTGLLQELGWPAGLADLVSDATGCHHGERASPSTLLHLEGDQRAIGADDWTQARRSLFEALVGVLRPEPLPTKSTLTGPDFMVLAGLTSFADWIGSNETWFPFGTPEDCGDIELWFRRRRQNAEEALDAIGWLHRNPLARESQAFESVFNFKPRPLQRAMAQTLNDLNEPALIVVEAPMGEGKTEAALFAHLELQRRFGHRGLYIALPTKATGNAMFRRTLDFLRGQSKGRRLDLQLLHGASLLNDEFQSIRLNGIHDPTMGGDVRAGEWFTHKKRALLSEYGVGTIDQAIVPILPVRHNFVRLWGLANRVVVFDEIHAYDAYTGTLLIHLLRWLLALGSSIVLLSATLPPVVRRELATLFNSKLPEPEVPYPRISVFSADKVKQVRFGSDPARRLTVRLQAIEPELPAFRAALEVHVAQGGMALALVNTVQRAQDLYRLFPKGEAIAHDGSCVGKRLEDGTEVLLFHARFPAEHRQRREDHALAMFGVSGVREGRKILIATQVAEQSLDLDFDVIAADLAPIDLLLQRAGRLWRHKRDGRPVAEPVLLVAGISGDQPPSLGKPLWWDSVYREDILLRTWCLFRGKSSVILPDEVDVLVQVVYEEHVDIPESLRERLEAAVIEAEGEMVAQRSQAHQAIVGMPDDASWNDPSRFVLFDEDQPGVHRTLMARTRLGEESVIAVPIFQHDNFDPDAIPSVPQSKHWYMRAVSLSRKGVVKRLQAGGIPAGWRKSPLLRNAFPMAFAPSGRWEEDSGVWLDDELGIVYEAKEVE